MNIFGGFIYIVKEIGAPRVKIGVSASPCWRLTQLSYATKNRLIFHCLYEYDNSRSAFRAERIVKKKLSAYALGKEWFKVSVSDMKYEIAKVGGYVRIVM